MSVSFAQKTVLLAFPDTASRSLLMHTLKEMGMDVAGTAADTNDVLSFLVRRECDFVFASIFLPMLPTEGLMNEIRALKLYKRPAVLYFAPENAGKMMLAAYTPTITLPAGKKEIEEALLQIYPVGVRKEDCQSAEEILIRMGFASVPARKYLAYACALCANDRDAARALKRRIYPFLARAFNVSETRIADAMRRVIDKTFLSGDIEAQYRLFLNSIDETRGKPTVSQLIALVGEILRRGSVK